MPVSLKKSTPNVTVKWSASHTLNNLTVNRLAETRRSTTYGVSHKNGFTMVTASDDGAKQIQAQVVCRAADNGHSSTPDADTRSIAYIVQAAFVNISGRNLLVLACTKTVQIYESDGTTNLYTHALDKNLPNRTELSTYSRGIAGIGHSSLCVGNHQGEILIFTIPNKGSNIFLKETKPGHQFGITSLASNTNLLLSSDTSGLIHVWNVRSLSQINSIRPVDESGITSLALWNNCIAASYVNGMIRFFDPENAQICGSISAHARCINAIDCNEHGLLASVGDDCFVRLWMLSGDAENLQIAHQYNYRMENQQLVGVKFTHLSRADIAIASYDSNEITILRPS